MSDGGLPDVSCAYGVLRLFRMLLSDSQKCTRHLHVAGVSSPFQCDSCSPVTFHAPEDDP